MMWVLCHFIVMLFCYFGIFLVIIGLIGFNSSDDRPQWFNTLFNTFFSIEDDD